VDVYDSISNFYIGYGVTDSNGSYTVQSLPTGNYKLLFSPPGSANYIDEWYIDKTTSSGATPVPVTAGAVTADINAQLAPGGSISGRITQADNGEGISCARIGVSNIGAGFYYREAYSDSNGNYLVAGLPAGNYRVSFFSYNSNYISEYFDNTDSKNATPVPVTVGAVTPNIDAKLTVGGSFSGTITDRNGQVIPNSIRVKVYDSTTQNVLGSTTASGSYRYYGLPAGTYKVLFDPYGNNNNYRGEWYDHQGTFALATPVQIIAGDDTPNINAQLDFGIYLPLIIK
jgi:hypothetical protein